MNNSQRKSIKPQCKKSRSHEEQRNILDESTLMIAFGKELHYKQYEKSITVLQEAILLNPYNWVPYDLMAKNFFPYSYTMMQQFIMTGQQNLTLLLDTYTILKELLQTTFLDLMNHLNHMKRLYNLILLQYKHYKIRQYHQDVYSDMKKRLLYEYVQWIWEDIKKPSTHLIKDWRQIHNTIMYKKGMVFYNMKQYDEAIKNLWIAQQLIPARFDPTKFIIRSYVKMNQIEKAFDIFDFLIEQNPNPLIYSEKASTHLQLKQYDAALNTYLPVIAQYPNDRLNLYYLSRVYFALGKYDEALKYLNNLLFDKPLFTYAYYIKGKIYRNQKKFKEAHNMFNKAFSKTIDDSLVYEKIAELQIHQGQYDDALTSLDNALKINQICLYAANNKGNLMMLKQEYQQAIIQYQKTILYNQDSRQEMFEYLEQYELFTADQKCPWESKNCQENVKPRDLDFMRWNI